jgi:hypothetical protein
MPRTLHANQEAARTAGVWTPYRFLKITWRAPVDVRYYSDRDFVADPGVTIEPILETLPHVGRQMEIGIKGRSISNSTQFTLRNDTTATFPILDILDSVVPIPQGTRVDAYYAFKPLSGSLTTAQWSTLGTYVIDTVDRAPAAGLATLGCIDYTEARGVKTIGRGISADDFPKAPETSYGLIMPHIFGSCEACPAIPVTVGETAILDGDIEADTTVLFFADASKLPESGTVVMGGEDIAYTFRSATQVGSTSSPVVRGANSTEATPHADGTTAREKLSQYWFLVADHECDNLPDTSSVDVNVSGKIVSATVSVFPIGAFSATFVVLSSLPPKTTPSAVAIPTDFDGTTTGWSDAGSTSESYVKQDDEYAIVANSADGAISGSDFRNVEFAYLSPVEAKSLFFVEYDNDLTGRTSQLSNLDLVIEYRVIPRTALIEAGSADGERTPADEYQFGRWEIEVLRAGSQIALTDLGQLSLRQFRGLLDNIGITPGLNDSRPLFGFGGTGSQANATLALRSPAFLSDEWYSDPATGSFRAEHWPDYVGKVAGDLFTADSLSLDFVATAGADRLGTRKELRPLRLNVVFPGDVAIIDSFEMTIDIHNLGDPIPNFSAELFVDGIENPEFSTQNLSGDQRVTFGHSEPLAATSIQYLEINASTNQFLSQTFTLLELANQLRFQIRAMNFRYIYQPTSGLLGETDPLLGADTRLAEKLLLSASTTISQRVPLTAIARQLADPWSFFGETIGLKIRAPEDAQSTDIDIMVINAFIQAKERPIVSRSVGADELEVTLNVDGVASGGSLVEAPEDVITYLIEDSRWYGLPGFVNAASLTAALSEQAAAGYKLARRIDQPITAREALSSACLNSAIWFAMEAGEFYFDAMGSLSKIAPTRVLDRSEMPPDALPVDSPVNTENVANQIALRFHRKFAGDREPTRRVPDLDSPQSQQFMGTIRESLVAEWIRDTKTATDLANRLLAQSAFPTKRITVTGTPEWLDVILTDKVLLNDADSGLINEPARVYRGILPDLLTMQFTVETQGFRDHFWVAAGDATTYIDVIPGSRILFVISGVVVAYLTADAEWFLKGALEVATVGGTQTEIIEKSGTSIFFAVDTDGIPPRSRICELTNAGDLRVALPQTSVSYPVLSPIADFITEGNAGTAIAKLDFSVDKEWKAATLALASLVARAYWTNQQL